MDAIEENYWVVIKPLSRRQCALARRIGRCISGALATTRARATNWNVISTQWKSDPFVDRPFISKNESNRSNVPFSRTVLHPVYRTGTDAFRSHSPIAGTLYPSNIVDQRIAIMTGISDDDHDAEDDPRADVAPLIDASDRLERVIERQLSTIDGIDDKAAHVTRLIGILIGLVFGVLSLAINVDPGSLPRADLPVKLAFILGMTGLLAAMGAAIITYLSSKFRSGLHFDVGYFLSEPDAETTFDSHLRRVLGTYAEIIEANELVITANSSRFRLTLLLLLVGVLFLSVTGAMYLSQLNGWISWTMLLVAIGLGIVATWYFLTGRYLTLDGVGGMNG